MPWVKKTKKPKVSWVDSCGCATPNISKKYEDHYHKYAAEGDTWWCLLCGTVWRVWVDNSGYMTHKEWEKDW